MSDAEARPAVILDLDLGYRHLDPLPGADELNEFYESAYVDLVRGGRRFPELAHLLAAGEETDRERAWLKATLHADIVDGLAAYVPGTGRVVIDVGCGLGEFVESATEAGWAAIGLEPSTEAVAMAVDMGRNVICATLESYVASGGPASGADAVVLTNVLEHVPDPLGVLTTIRGLLKPAGAVAVRVPNDFNPLQEAATALLGHRPWWIAAPDHVNYFDHASLRHIVERAGYTVVDQWADFPMELFLLMGEDYVGDHARGPVCHRRRQQLELSLDASDRRRWGHSLVPLGWGRNSVVIALAPADA
jgi:SAM-dependent methyltransferase